MFNPEEVAKQTHAPQQRDELVFRTPWEARVFAMIAHLSDQEKFVWDDFRDELIASIAQGDVAPGKCDEASGTPYYRAWLAAAEKLLDSSEFCTRDELEYKIQELSDPRAAGKLSPTGPIAGPVSEA